MSSKITIEIDRYYWIKADSIFMAKYKNIEGRSGLVSILITNIRQHGYLEVVIDGQVSELLPYTEIRQCKCQHAGTYHSHATKVRTYPTAKTNY